MRHFSALIQLLVTSPVAGSLFLLLTNIAQAHDNEDNDQDCTSSICVLADWIYDYMLIDTEYTNTIRTEFRRMVRDVFG